ncbi:MULTISPECIES: succinate dehydrogenase cytochrome b subunit [Myroides]|uniref:succinate dehydrogenase cytochrome b subunit n=1 Tax=Myroides TaxID=76831 RepID=UPI000280A83A|nr:MULTISPECIES: succinate dehydrogenase cytochrome b subunit [Myroides]APA93968.1 succinate dehydrogenase [Myroides sp. ZB35]EKB05432.1 b558 family succinate dehydrogenase (or fumarate reductase) cytochrome B subunit [Myroides odoratimimus CCUG 3837]MDX4973516.1 succinate dehydrogenase cytochrome b subunit [Myroides odoratimimus]
MNTLSRKIVMAATGLFLCFFLLIHFLGNTQLFLEPEHARLSFNAYSHFLTGNPLVKMVSYVLYASIIGHAIYALIITSKNKASGGTYKKDNRGRASKWYSRNMGVLGTIVLIFIVLHFQNFWYVYKFGEIGIDANGNKDLYAVVVTAFQELWLVVVYVIAMVALCYHLIHGITSGVRTLGLFHPKFVRWVNIFGVTYSVIICVGFAAMPIFIYITNLKN